MISKACVFSAVLASVLAWPSAAIGQDQQGAIPRVEVRRNIAVGTACPDVFKELPQTLYSVWRDLDTPAKIMVDFKLDGDKVDEVKMSGGYWDYYAPIRRAVRAMKCHSPGEGKYAVRFMIQFAYPENDGEAMAGLQVINADHPLASVVKPGDPGR